mgnify:CR=1 FL=1
MKRLITLLEKQNKKIAVAESCTGGLVSKMITDISGASEVFEIGLVTYSNQMKIAQLGVDPEIIEIFGVYSLETAGAMAMAIAKKAGADIGIGITGVAGSEPQEGIPAGKVFIALASENTLHFTETEPQNADRKAIKETAIKAVIKLLKQYLDLKED